MLANEFCPDLFVVDFYEHPVEPLFNYPAVEFGRGEARVAIFFCRRILKHHRAVLIVDICECKCIRGEIVKKSFLNADIFCKGFVVIQMVVGYVGEKLHL